MKGKGGLCVGLRPESFTLAASNNGARRSIGPRALETKSLESEGEYLPPACTGLRGKNWLRLRALGAEVCLFHQADFEEESASCPKPGVEGFPNPTSCQLLVRE